MQAGTRALGIAESYSGSADESYATLAGAVVRADRVVDGIGFDRTTVGGLDVTDAVCRLVDRDDVRLVLLSGIALSWYNLCDLRAVHDRIDRPVLSVSYGESDGLEAAIRREFDGEPLRKRLEIYWSLPCRRSVSVDGRTVFVRSIGDVETEAVVRRFTLGNARPEPVRVAKLAARAAHAYRHS
ncbi:DUF99 family protein [Natranaeroarchaeum aerophilus]|uniref:UPF0215 protein AArcSt11_05170 n=1 Tax=Natranaeroarchaeum aerophilus TaxID=2917711 RepID=A0AAE3K4Z3_9EURY|nr:DUF99 family protein [Natranaeroarchaeum aerophilus]MCL9813040.1 DUF99 family protein [Natranaeroarchaeum aerophilus]